MTQASVPARRGSREIVNPDLRAAAETYPHLRLYLSELPVDLEEPTYVLEPNRKNTKPGPRNLIYPVPGGLFTHILNDDEDARDYYVAIDPAYLVDLTSVISHLEKALLDYVDELEGTDNDEEKKEVLLRAAEENLKVVSGPSTRGRKRDEDDIEVTKEELEAVKYLVIRDKLGLGLLDPLIHDPFIEDISCSGIGNLFIEHKVYGSLKASIIFTSTEELDTFVLRLSERIKKPVTFRNPISDATLPDGSRINIVYGNDISTRGSNFTIRKFTAVPLSIIDIIDSGGISYEMAAYLSLCVQEGMNYFVSGETASGKTTLLNALTCFYEPAAKIVSIEDTPELQVPHPNWTREVVRGSMSGAGGGDSGVGMFALLKAALRQRPNAIIVGEIRGEEGAIAFQAMQTGHACAATFHASSVEKLIQRLTGSPISVPKTYVDNLNVVCIASAVRLPNGRPGRRILSISELIGYDSTADAFSFMEVYHWNSFNDTFEATGQMNSYLMETHIGPKRGFAPGDKRGIYNEIYKRARLFERLHKAGRNNFFDLYKAFAQAQRQGAI